ncbi:MAG: hypothetical protein OXI32_02360 [bacterium]|nr:hypothetical protein [bacterium]
MDSLMSWLGMGPNHAWLEPLRHRFEQVPGSQVKHNGPPVPNTVKRMTFKWIASADRWLSLVLRPA